MEPSARTRQVLRGLAGLAAVAALATAPRAAPAAAEGGGALPPPLLEGTPLVLKDGRMAYVSIRAVPFAPGADTLSPEVAAEVGAMAAGLASDCFLTAQAIGHVEPGAAGEGDTLAAHRLARARAERVQKALAEKGLPANAIAGVWDWQFLVREPRVTLWVFSMREGEDCAGEPLAPGRKAPAPLVASAEPPARKKESKRAAAAAAGEPRPAAPKATEEPAPGEPAVAAAAVAPPAPAPGATGATGATTTAFPPSAVAEAEPEPSPAQAPPTPAEVTPAAGRADAGPEAPRRAERVAALAPAAPEPEAAEGAPREAAAGVARLEIVFDTNSSYLPAGAGAELRRWVEALPPAKGYRIALAAAAGAASSATKGGPPDEGQAARYDRWLAERRLGRVAEWLERNARVPELDLTSRELVGGDGSRRVVLEARPLP